MHLDLVSHIGATEFAKATWPVAKNPPKIIAARPTVTLPTFRARDNFFVKCTCALPYVILRPCMMGIPFQQGAEILPFFKVRLHSSSAVSLRVAQ